MNELENLYYLKSISENLEIYFERNCGKYGSQKHINVDQAAGFIQ